MRRLHNAVLVLIVTAAPAFAQNEPSVPRAVQPDKFLWRADATFDRGRDGVDQRSNAVIIVQRGEVERPRQSRRLPETLHRVGSLAVTRSAQLFHQRIAPADKFLERTLVNSAVVAHREMRCTSIVQ